MDKSYTWQGTCQHWLRFAAASGKGPVVTVMAWHPLAQAHVIRIALSYNNRSQRSPFIQLLIEHPQKPGMVFIQGSKRVVRVVGWNGHAPPPTQYSSAWRASGELPGFSWPATAWEMSDVVNREAT